jgi:hypothetical protein
MVNVHRRWVAAAAVAACAVAFVTSGCASASSAAPGGGAHGGGTTPPPSANPAVVARDKSNGHTLTLKVGQHLELVLGSTYWTVRGSSVPSVLKQDGPSHLLKRPPSCGRIPGLGCVPIRTDFSALAPGTAVITASRQSCGEALRCMPSQQHYTLTVVVR